MFRGGFICAAACIFACVSLANTIEIAFFEARDTTYIQAATLQSPIDGSVLLASAAALLSVDPGIIVSPEQSEKISSIVKSRPFDSAQALLSITIAGLQQGDLALERPAISFTGDEDVLKGLISLVQANNAEQTPLDTSNLPGCGEACLEQLLTQMTEDLRMNASYSRGEGPLRGEWTVRAASGQKSSFNLVNVADRMLAVEVSSFWAAVNYAASENSRRNLQGAESYQTPQILSRAFISPQLIREAYGPSSLQYAATKELFQQLLEAASMSLQQSLNNQMVGIYTTVETVKERQESDLWALIQSSSTPAISRRSLLASESESDYTNNFIAWIAMWGTFILVVFFLLAGTHCLKSMKFKQDSLLYGKNKSE